MQKVSMQEMGLADEKRPPLTPLGVAMGWL